MFTGIVTDIGTVRAIEKRGDTRFEIATAYDLASIAIGASIACTGCCLTVIEKGRTGSPSKPPPKPCRRRRSATGGRAPASISNAP